MLVKTTVIQLFKKIVIDGHKIKKKIERQDVLEIFLKGPPKIEMLFRFEENYYFASRILTAQNEIIHSSVIRLLRIERIVLLKPSTVFLNNDL